MRCGEGMPSSQAGDALQTACSQQFFAECSDERDRHRRAEREGLFLAQLAADF